MQKRRALTVAALCASFAAAIPGAAEAQEASARAAAGDMVLHSSDELHWQSTEFKGVQVAVLWGDPESESQGGELLKVESGLAFSEHAHRYDERVLVISGTFVFILPGKPERRLGPGSYYYLPANVAHSSRCSSGQQCIVYSEVIPRTPKGR